MHICQKCGDTLIRDPNAARRYTCPNCGTAYTDKAAEAHTENLREVLGDLFDELQMKQIGRLRRNLYDAVHAKYISREAVERACVALRQVLPDDFAAGFYLTASGGNLRALNQAINQIDVEKHYDELSEIVPFLVKSLTSSRNCLLSLAHLVERAYKGRDLALYSRYATMVEEQAERVFRGVYEPSIPRHVFVAYSSRDMERVNELVEALEAQKITCFVASRNLRHGIGSVEEYDTALRTAMDKCRIFLLVSGLHSRDLDCDALTREMAYVQEKDIANAPPEHRYNYAAIPHEYKKPRVEYRLEESPDFNVADTLVDEFFEGYERVYDVQGVMVRVAEILYGVESKPVPPTPTPKSEPNLQSAPRYSKGLKFELTQDKKGYALKGIGRCTDTKVVIPTTYKGLPVITIRSDAFCQNRKITEVVIPFGVKSIESAWMFEGAFSHCTGLTSVTIPESVTTIGKYTFQDCTGLTSVTIPEGVTSIGFSAFSDCTGLTSVVIPKGVTSIESHAFSGCTGLTSIVIPEGVTSIGDGAFSCCTGLTSIVIPEGVTSIGDGAFSSCTGLTSLTVSSLNPHYYSEGNCIIEATSGKLVAGCQSSTIPRGVTVIGRCAFQGHTGLIHVTLPSGVQCIEDGAFNHCTGLTSMNIPKGVTSIGDHAFSYCAALEEISIPEGVESIQLSAFHNCDSLTSIAIPSSVTSIGVRAMFGWIIDSHSISVAPQNTTYRSENHCIIEIATNKLIVGCNQSIIPKGVTSIGSAAFAGCSSMTSVVLPASVTCIESSAFQACSGLTCIIIPDSVTNIAQYAFIGCQKLNTIIYQGTKAQWKAIQKYDPWHGGTSTYTVHCTDGDLKPFLGIKP